MARTAGFCANRLIIIVLCCSVFASSVNISVLGVGVEEKVIFFEKILQKNLEVKKKSVSLQPI